MLETSKCRVKAALLKQEKQTTLTASVENQPSIFPSLHVEYQKHTPEQTDFIIYFF